MLPSEVSESDPISQGGCYWGLNTWTAARGSVACVTIYFEELSDLDWAIGVWKSVRPREAMRIMN